MRKKHNFKKLLTLFLVSALLLPTGCAIKAPSELYRLPQQPDSYYNLYSALEEVITGDMAYSPPVSGENRQAIQMQDMDGDGRNEAVVFAKGTDEHPLKIFIFSRSVDDSFTLASTIEGDGISYESVRYAQLDGSPGLELVVGRTVSEQVLHSLSVYTLQSSLTMELVSAMYTAYTVTDLNGDGRGDLFLLRSGTDTLTVSAELYHYQDGALLREPELALTGSGSLKRMITGNSAENLPAVFVATQSEGGIVTTDVFIMQDGVFSNIAASTDMTNVTVRSYPAYATDLDEDGLIELPEVIPLSSAEQTDYQLIQWYNLTRYGKKHVKLLTYHDYSLGCYLVLEDGLKDSLSITEQAAEHGTAYGFSLPGSDLFTLYVYTGTDAAELAADDGRFLLGEKNETMIAASLGSDAADFGITEDTLKNNFNWIRTDWNTGEM